MSLSKTSIQSLGVIISGTLALGTFFLVVQPLSEKTTTNNTSLEQAKILTTTKSLKLKQLEAGVTTFEQAKSDTKKFLSLNPQTKDIESVSRSISTALVDGVTIVSFTFGNNEEITPLKEPVASLGSYAAPFTLSDTPAPKASEGSTESAPSAPTTGFIRVPVVVTVTAANNAVLAQYTDSLANQARLISVVSVNSERPASDGEVKATIYGYAFIYSR